MRGIILIGVVMLAGCQPAPEGKSKKTCDHGRAVYVTDNGYRGGTAIAIVENAPECAA